MEAVDHKGRVIDMLDEMVDQIRIMEVKVACSGYDSSAALNSISYKLLEIVDYIDRNFPNKSDN
jgi:hypothetical protein